MWCLRKKLESDLLSVERYSSSVSIHYQVHFEWIYNKEYKCLWDHASDVYKCYAARTKRQKTFVSKWQTSTNSKIKAEDFRNTSHQKKKSQVNTQNKHLQTSFSCVIKLPDISMGDFQYQTFQITKWSNGFRAQFSISIKKELIESSANYS